WSSGASGAALSASAFEVSMPGIGGAILTLALVVFAFTTILGWSYYGEKCWEFLLGTKSTLPYRTIWVVLIPFGAVSLTGVAWQLAVTLNVLVSVLILGSLIRLGALVVKLTREYFRAQGTRYA